MLRGKGLQKDDTDDDRAEHCFCAELVALLYPPETINTYCLGCDANQEEVGEGQSVV